MRMRFTVVLVLALAGCMKPNPLIYTLGQDSTDSESGDGDGDPGDGDPGDGDPGDGDSGDGDSGDGDSGDGDSGETAPMDMPDAQCGESLEPIEVGCGECLALDCCDFALACAEVEQCLCLADCILAGNSPGSCKNDCGGVSAGDVDELQPVLDCAALHCEQDC